jgi:hypothetical protein
MGRRPEVRLLADDLPGEALKFLARPEAEIIQVAPRPLVHLECLDVAPRAIERDHELRDEPLAIRRSTALQVQRHPREHRAVPEAERLLRDGRGTRMVTGGQRDGCLVYEVFEDQRVENGSTEVDPVAAPSSLESNPVRGESPAEPGHVRLQAVRCGSRGIVPPDLIEQPLDGHDLVTAEKQGRENSLRLAPAELERVPPDPGLEPAEDANRRGSGAAVSSS